jgi:hypothetical protein
MCVSKPVTKELPLYWLLLEHRFAKRLLAEPLAQNRIFLAPWERLFHHSGIQPNRSHSSLLKARHPEQPNGYHRALFGTQRNMSHVCVYIHISTHASSRRRVQGQFCLSRMSSCGIWRRMALVAIDVSEERISSIFRVRIIGELVTMLAVTSNLTRCEELITLWERMQ